MKYLFGLILFVYCGSLFGQAGEWTWIKGNNFSNSFGNLGTQGVSSPTNEPTSVYGGLEWKDLNGNFWIYGGNDPANLPLNDLWKYDPVVNEWTWITGTNARNDPGNYGIQGIPAATNHPPSIGYGGPTWTDQSNNLWMFAGYNGGPYSDLWEYEISTNTWTWMKGPGTQNTFGIYGTMTVADTANFPTSRWECLAAWTDINNDLWFFGGITGLYMNDMWKYNISSNSWTWMKGSSTGYPSNVYGTLGIEDTANVPSGRASYTHWMDGSGNFWIFGGLDVSGRNNDLWRYNPQTNNWSWWGGSNQVASYGTQCQSSTASWPDGRYECRADWVDANGNFWMYGGNNGYGKSDLWKYSISNHEWTWIDGDSLYNVPANWGTQNVASATNNPGTRYGAAAWIGNNKKLYLFGGGSMSFVTTNNDVWVYEIDSTCGTNNVFPNAQFIISDSVLCEGVCANFINQSINATSYQWFFPGATPSSATTANPQNICYSAPGSYDVTLVASNGAGTDSFTLSNAIVVNPPVQFSPITRNGDTLFSTQGYVSYQWYVDATLITGANNFYYVATQNGDYAVQVEDSNGCSATAIMINVIATTDEKDREFFSLAFSENAINMNYHLSNSSEAGITLNSDIGQLIYSDKRILHYGNNVFELTNKKISPGIYFINVMIGKKIYSRKIFIQ
jgi:hypothetical protein